MDGHPPSLGGSPTNPRMITHQREVYYRLGNEHLHITRKTNTRCNCYGWPPTNPRMVTQQKEVSYRLRFWELHIT